jgi:hypothetical protein
MQPEQFLVLHHQLAQERQRAAREHARVRVDGRPQRARRAAARGASRHGTAATVRGWRLPWVTPAHEAPCR